MSRDSHGQDLHFQDQNKNSLNSPYSKKDPSNRVSLSKKKSKVPPSSSLLFSCSSPFFYIFFFLLSIQANSIFLTFSHGNSPPINLGLAQLHKYSSIHKVSSWPYLLRCLTTKNPHGFKVGCKQPTKWPKTEPKPCLRLIWSEWVVEQQRLWAPIVSKSELPMKNPTNRLNRFPTGRVG